MTASQTQTDTSAENPVGQFSHAHVGIVMQLDRMAMLPVLLSPAQMAKDTAQRALDFFRGAVFEHHQEEERELFPAVLSSAQPGDERHRVEQLVDSLTREHRGIEEMWSQLEPQLKKIAKGQSFELDTPALQALIERYQVHAHSEETQFLPLSETILGRNGNHMAALGMSLHMHRQPIRIGHI